MTRSRGRPVRPIPVHPERVISRAVKAGLSATIRLQRDICNKNTRKYYDRSRERFSIRQEVYQITKERGSPDFSYISMVEAPIRTDARLMLYENAINYGFTEVRRQKNSDDTVDPLNQRFNACGAVVRENSEVDFPLPEPVDFGIYTRWDGKGRKKYRRAGYEGSSFGPKVILAHPDLPSLDFGDAIRSHNEYLATFCAIHDVPVSETTRYSHLFYLFARPYLEYIYSEFKFGRKNFQKGVNWALRQVKELILKDGYQPTMHEKRTVTKELEFDEDKIKRENKAFFKRIEEEAREFYGDHAAVIELKRLRGKLGEEKEKAGDEEEDDSLLTGKDVIHIRNEAARRARITGSIMHRRLVDLFPSPWHLNDVILSGDRYTRSSDHIIIAEAPIQTQYGAGRIDLILCVRTISDDGKRAFWKPVLALEIKTRLGQSMYVDANYKESDVRSEESKSQRVVSEFPLSDYPLSEDLWDSIVQSTPTPAARTQLDIYCQALGEHYKTTTGQESGHILRGVLVIEASSDITEIRPLLQRLIIHGYEEFRHRSHRIKRTVFTPPENGTSRIALVIDEQPGLGIKNDERIATPWKPLYNPIKVETKTEREFILYLAGHSPTSAGQSAAWNARYFHGLQMLYEMKRTHDSTEFLWIDLASQFNEPQLAEARLRLRPRGYSEEEIAKVQPDHIQEFFEEIKVIGYLDDALSFLYGDCDLPSIDLNITEKRRVIIVSGADTLRDATPASHRERLSELMEHLLSSLSDDENTNVVWFDSPVPSVEKSIPYSTRALLPYFETSPLGGIVTKIVWNLPIAPRSAVQPEKWNLSTIGDSPMHDDIRVIIRYSPKSIHLELTHVPFLRKWSKRFRNKGSGRVNREQEIDDIVPDNTTRDRMKLLSMTMLPWLVWLLPQDTFTNDSNETLEEQIECLQQEYRGGSEPLKLSKTILTESPCRPPSLLDLVKFRLPRTKDTLAYQAMTSGKINSQRLYRATRKLQTQPLQKVPESSPIIDISVIEEVPAQRWVFGIKFESEDEDIQSWWMVVQDPDHPRRVLAGCFTDESPDKDGFLWAESRPEVLIQSSANDIVGFLQTMLIGRKNENGMDIWTIIDGETPVYAGKLELRGQGYSTIGHLRAMRQTSTEEPIDGPSVTIRPPESFYKRAVEALRKLLASVASPIPVNVRLEMIDDSCRVSLRDNDSEIWQVKINYTADLLSFLRWPMIKGGPMFTDSGEYVTWSIFNDIDYGELDFIRPYVTYTAARKTPEELPKRIIQFFDEAEKLSVSISHDTSICPLVTGNEVDHGACWRINLSPECPEIVGHQLDRPLTGEDVNGLLASGKFFAGKLYNLDFALPRVSAKDESIVFHEERYIRMLLRNKGLSLRKLVPGTYLKVGTQQWRISISWEDSYLKWSAQSLVSGLSLTGNQQQIKLTHGRGTEEECDRLSGIITSQIPATQIHEYADLKEQILSGLKSRGYSTKSPRCELRVMTQSENHYEYGAFLAAGPQSDPLSSYRIEVDGPMNHDEIIDGITERVYEGDLSAYNIVNRDDFLAELADWVREYIPSADDWSEEPEEWTVTLSVDVESGEIVWVARQGTNGPLERGTMYLSPEEMRLLGQEEACEEVRRLFELGVIPHLREISNLDDVFEEQIPEIVRRIILGK